jgi:NADH-quinone oxidoreductase subunit L
MLDNPQNFAWLILLLPLASALIITLFTRKNPNSSASISIAAVLVSFFSTIALFLYFRSTGTNSLPQVHTPWLRIDDFQVDIGLRLDNLSFMMALIVTGVGSAIHIFSAGYMKGDRAYSRFFACLSLFTFSMLGIVFADNFVMMFIFWELVGISSYLLIGFWYEKPTAADACKKAFLTNRVGDFGFLLGIMMVWMMFKTVSFTEIGMKLAMYLDANGSSTAFKITGLLIFCGAMGKSAQFPLHVWLPDAMEGPTPVSALIHAATMVAAGVYMLCRVFFILEPSGALPIIAWIGGGTALMAALIAVQQDDIKRILAYSTLSQLGYMVMAVGLSGPTPAMFHLTTHAFFKALLFLGAGSVIHGMHHEQDIWKMGGLKKHMPATYWTFLAGTLALCGVIPFSGFYSKDGILGQALIAHQPALFALAVGVALLTTFYMTRLFIVVFLGNARSGEADHAHESPPIMVWPLRFLAVLSIIGGLIGIEALFEAQFEPGKQLHELGIVARIFEPFTAQPVAAWSGLGVVVLGFLMAWGIYGRAISDPLPCKLGGISKAMKNRFYFDELYENYLIPMTQGLASWIADMVDRWIIGGVAVRFTHGSTELIGRALRLFQNGSLQTYAFLIVSGIALVIYLVLLK